MEIVNNQVNQAQVGGWVGCGIGCAGMCVLSGYTMTAIAVAVYAAT